MITIESTRVHPSTRPPAPISTPLSVLDATVARFSPTGAIWIFDELHCDKDTLVSRLRSSFVATLSLFPHWAGQLKWAPVQPGGSHTERFNRPQVVHGTDSDPGVEWTVVEHPFHVHDVVPTAKERAESVAGARRGAWVGNGFAQEHFVPSTPLALHNLRDCTGLPGMLVQINFSLGGGYAIGIKIAHALADAQALMTFTHNWMANSRKCFGAQPYSSPLLDNPVFDPTLLDACAAGDIDAPEPDTALTTAARPLPMHRYSWWDTFDPGYPAVCVPTTENSKPPPNILEPAIKQGRVSASTPAPWSTWDPMRPASYVQLHFSEVDLDRLRRMALDDPQTRRDISRLDVLLAHVWTAINRARGHSETSTEVFLDMSLGARTRVTPALPGTFIGSPMIIAYVGGPGSEVCNSSLGTMASRVRETVLQFTPAAMGAILHDAAHEISPQRLWQGFLGSHHTLVTSWLRLQLYSVNFDGSDCRPRYVHALMDMIDGCIQVMDTGVNDGGMDVAVYLDSASMERMLNDTRL